MPEEVSISLNFNLKLSDCKLDSIISAFQKILLQLLAEVIHAVALHFAESRRLRGELKCPRCGGTHLKWKTRHAGRTARLLTVYGRIEVRQLQVVCADCGKKHSLLRDQLGLGARAHVTADTEAMLGLVCSLTSYRSAAVLLGMAGAALPISTLHRCTRRAASRISFSISPDEQGIAEADGTDLPFPDSGQRGKEGKVMIQKRKAPVDGEPGWRVAGFHIGQHFGEWDRLFGPSREAIAGFDRFMLVTDGDMTIPKGLENVDVVLQRCLWHIPHQLKHRLWKDGVPRETALWRKLMSMSHSVVTVPRVGTRELDDCLIKEKEGILDDMLLLCGAGELAHCKSYLENARPCLFGFVSARLEGRTTSAVERVMRTIRQRIGCGPWSVRGADAVCRIRLAYYYNGFNPMRSRTRDIG